MAFSPDGRRLATAGWDGTVRLWDPATGAEPATLTGHTGGVDAVAFSPDGRRAGHRQRGRDGAAVGPGHRRRSRPPSPATPAGWTAVAFSPDGQLLASAGSDGTVRLWDPATGARAGAPSPATPARCTAVAFSPDGRRLASAGEDGTVRLWDAATGAEQATLTGHTGRVTAVAFSPDGRLLATAGDDGTVRLWDPATGQPSRPPSPATPAGCTRWRSARTGGGSPPPARTGRCGCGTRPPAAELATLTGHTSGVYAVAFSPDGRRLATASDDGTVRLWDPATGSRAGHPDRPHQLGAPRWRSARTGGGSPPPATTGRCGCGTRPPAPQLATLDRPHRPGVRGGVQPGRAAAGHRRQGRDGAAVGPGHRRRAGHPAPATPAG